MLVLFILGAGKFIRISGTGSSNNRKDGFVSDIMWVSFDLGKDDRSGRSSGSSNHC